MKNINWYKVIVWSVVIIAIFLVGRSCGSGGNPFSCNRGQDTVSHSIDTTVIRKIDSISYIPIPYKTDTVWIPGKPYAVHDTLEIYERGNDYHDYDVISSIPFVIDTPITIRKFFNIHYYQDTFKFSRNTVFTWDTISQNSFWGRKIIIESSDTLIKESTTLTRPKKNIWYLSTSIMGNRNELVNGVGFGLALKAKNDHIYGAETKILKGGNIFYEAQVKFPIRLKRKK